MKAKEKAIQLVEKYIDLQDENLKECDYRFAKLCALIAVNETIKETMLHDLTIYQHGRTAYWQEVKIEIEKL